MAVGCFCSLLAVTGLPFTADLSPDTTCLFLGRLSKSQRITCCQVPRTSLPSMTGIVREGPSRAARTWE